MKKLKIITKEVVVLEKVVEREVFVNDDEASLLQPFLSMDNDDDFSELNKVAEKYFRTTIEEKLSSFLISSTILESKIEGL